MEVDLRYYELKNDKKMGDGDLIPQGQDLILIKEDSDGMMFFETHNTDSKKLFWASRDDVNFLQTSIETWDEEKIKKRNRYINGEFL